MKRSPTLELAALGAATARLASLIGDDKIFEPVRNKIRPGTFTSKLLGCTVWCLPIWAAVALRLLPRPARTFVVDILTAAAIAAPINVLFGRWHLPGEHRAFPIRTAIITAANAASMAAEAAMMKASTPPEGTDPPGA